MMNSQQLGHLSALVGGPARSLSAGFVMPLGRHGGELEVIHGRVWLTRAGEPEDRVVAGGEAVHVPASGSALIEAWDDGRPALVAWRPRSPWQHAGDAVRSAWARSRALASAAVLHNGVAAGTDASRASADREGHSADAAVALRQRPRFAAQEARRCATGAA